VLAAARMLPDEALDRQFEMGMDSLRRTLAHLYDAELWWFNNCQGNVAPGFVESPPNTALDDLASRFDALAEQRNSMLAQRSDADLRRVVHAEPIPDKRRSFMLGDVLLQLCTHGTHHRAQALNMLRHLGGTPPGLDYITYLRAQPGYAPARTN
jgi:uncharacterized damage-inducible protein DinB